MNNRSKVWLGMGLLLIAAAFFGGWLMFAPPGQGGAPEAGAGGNQGGPGAVGAAPAARGGGAASLGPPPVSVVGLKDAYYGKVRVGTALDVSAGGRGTAQLSDRELALVRENFNVLVPENCMKPQPIHPAEATWSFAAADAFMEFAAANGQQVVGHVLVWHAQTPQWFFQGDGGAQASREVLTERMKTHIQTLVGRYKGRVMVWNVVNEPINDGTGGGENLRNSNWLRILGPDYIGMAFRFAHEADPGAMLFYNDYNIEKGAKHESSMALLRRLKAEGVPVDGVGIQGHWSSTSMPSVAELEKAIADYQSLGLKVAFSELDITGPNTGARGAAALAAPAGGDATDPQVEAYRQVMKVVLAHREAFSHVIFYGLDDRRSWRTAQKPTLFDTEGQTKPAWQAVMELGKGG